jgi:hypothetical protein
LAAVDECDTEGLFTASTPGVLEEDSEDMVPTMLV